MAHPFTSGELSLHHRYDVGHPITCGVSHGCVTPIADDVRCPNCLANLKCPTCESPEPRLHPATQSEGEVIALCPDPFHGSRAQAMAAGLNAAGDAA